MGRRMVSGVIGDAQTNAWNYSRTTIRENVQSVE